LDADETEGETPKLAAVAQSSGAEYLDGLHLKYEKYDNLAEALSSLADAGRTPSSTAWARYSTRSPRASRKLFACREFFSRQGNRAAG
jgi:hypothetical protein